MDSTAISWTAYLVKYWSNCGPDEIVGYFTNRQSAETARLAFISEKNLKEKGICCSDSSRVEVQEITIIP